MSELILQKTIECTIQADKQGSIGPATIRFVAQALYPQFAKFIKARPFISFLGRYPISSNILSA
jgi:hypothetical protein